VTASPDLERVRVALLRRTLGGGEHVGGQRITLRRRYPHDTPEKRRLYQ
jgi:hypothetical protein